MPNEITLADAVAMSRRENRRVDVWGKIDDAVALDGYEDGVQVCPGVYDVWGDDWRLTITCLGDDELPATYVTEER